MEVNVARAMENQSGRRRAAEDLDQLIQEFRLWQKATKDVQQENLQLSSQLKVLQKRCLVYEHAQKAASEDNDHLRSTIDQLQGTLMKRCELEEENHHLKKQVQLMQEEAAQLEQQHCQQMAEAVENLRVAQETHKSEISHLQDRSNQQLKKEVDSLQRLIQDKVAEIRLLRKQQADAERDKHTEMVKLRLEYDAKLLKMQKQNAKSQAAQSSGVNSDIFRRKLQHAKAESERETSSLRKRIGDLERQLAAANKRRKL